MQVAKRQKPSKDENPTAEDPIVVDGHVDGCRHMDRHRLLDTGQPRLLRHPVDRLATSEASLLYSLK